VKSGKQIEWYVAGMKKKSVSWREGLLHGTYREYHENGELQEKGEYNNGRLQGPFASWYGNKQQRLKLTYHQDILDGLAQEWYENGTLKTEGQWQKGVREGLWKWHDRYGDELFEIEYNKGIITHSTAPDGAEAQQTASR